MHFLDILYTLAIFNGLGLFFLDYPKKVRNTLGILEGLMLFYYGYAINHGIALGIGFLVTCISVTLMIKDK